MKILLGLIPILLVIGFVPIFASYSDEITEERIQVNIHGNLHYLDYIQKNVSLTNARVDLQSTSLIFDVVIPKNLPPDETSLLMFIPRDIFDSKLINGQDADFIISVNGNNTKGYFFEEDSTSLIRALKIHLPYDTNKLEIIGSVFSPKNSPLLEMYPLDEIQKKTLTDQIQNWEKKIIDIDNLFFQRIIELVEATSNNDEIKVIELRTSIGSILSLKSVYETLINTLLHQLQIYS